MRMSFNGVLLVGHFCFASFLYKKLVQVFLHLCHQPNGEFYSSDEYQLRNDRWRWSPVLDRRQCILYSVFIVFSVTSTALCIYSLIVSHVYLLSIFNINVDIVRRYLFLETCANCHQHAVVPITAAKEGSPVSSQG